MLIIHDELGKGHRRNTAERSPERRAITLKFTTSYGENVAVRDPIGATRMIGAVGIGVVMRAMRGRWVGRVSIETKRCLRTPSRGFEK